MGRASSAGGHPGCSSVVHPQVCASAVRGRGSQVMRWRWPRVTGSRGTLLRRGPLAGPRVPGTRWRWPRVPEADAYGRFHWTGCTSTLGLEAVLGGRIPAGVWSQRSRRGAARLGRRAGGCNPAGACRQPRGCRRPRPRTGVRNASDRRAGQHSRDACGNSKEAERLRLEFAANRPRWSLLVFTRACLQPAAPCSGASE